MPVDTFKPSWQQDPATAEWEQDFRDIHGRHPEDVDHADWQWSQKFVELEGRPITREDWQRHYFEDKSLGERLYSPGAKYSYVPEFAPRIRGIEGDMPADQWLEITPDPWYTTMDISTPEGRFRQFDAWDQKRNQHARGTPEYDLITLSMNQLMTAGPGSAPWQFNFSRRQGMRNEIDELTKNLTDEQRVAFIDDWVDSKLASGINPYSFNHPNIQMMPAIVASIEDQTASDGAPVVPPDGPPPEDPSIAAWRQQQDDRIERYYDPTKPGGGRENEFTGSPDTVIDAATNERVKIGDAWQPIMATLWVGGLPPDWVPPEDPSIAARQMQQEEAPVVTTGLPTGVVPTELPGTTVPNILDEAGKVVAEYIPQVEAAANQIYNTATNTFTDVGTFITGGGGAEIIKSMIDIASEVVETAGGVSNYFLSLLPEDIRQAWIDTVKALTGQDLDADLTKVTKDAKVVVTYLFNSPDEVATFFGQQVNLIGNDLNLPFTFNQSGMLGPDDTIQPYYNVEQLSPGARTGEIVRKAVDKIGGDVGDVVEGAAPVAYSAAESIAKANAAGVGVAGEVLGWTSDFLDEIVKDTPTEAAVDGVQQAVQTELEKSAGQHGASFWQTVEWIRAGRDPLTTWLGHRLADTIIPIALGTIDRASQFAVGLAAQGLNLPPPYTSTSAFQYADSPYSVWNDPTLNLIVNAPSEEGERLLAGSRRARQIRHENWANKASQGQAFFSRQPGENSMLDARPSPQLEPEMVGLLRQYLMPTETGGVPARQFMEQHARDTIKDLEESPQVQRSLEADLDTILEEGKALRETLGQTVDKVLNLVKIYYTPEALRNR